MLSNAYFLAKFRFDTAENEPAKNLQNFANFPNFAKSCTHSLSSSGSRDCRSSQALLRGSERSFRRGGRAARSDVQTKLLASHERCRFKKQEQRILNVALLLFVSDSILKIELNAEA